MSEVEKVLIRRGFVLSFFALMTLSFAACRALPEEKVFRSLEEGAQIEQQLSEENTSFVALESEEAKLYEQLMMLSLEEITELERLSQELVALAKQRQELLAEEKAMMEQSFETYEKAKEALGILEMEVEEVGKELDDWMKKRKNSYFSLVEKYREGIKKDIQLYESLRDKELTLEQLEVHIQEINDTYKQVEEKQKTFNEATKAFNEAKLKLYKQLGWKFEEENGS